MKHVLAVLALVFVTSAALAADDGQTQPRISYATNTTTTNVDIIPTTNGSGNVKGVHCQFTDNGITAPNPTVTFTIDGGTPQSITLDGGYAPLSHDASGTVFFGYTGWVPYNLRFTTSIRVQVKKATAVSGTAVGCGVSWALD